MQGLGALVLFAAECPALAIQSLGQAAEAGGVCVHLAAESRHLGGAGTIEAHAVTEGRGADLEPEARAVVHDGAVLDGEPEMVLVGAAPEEPPGIPVDARDVHVPLKIGDAPGKQGEGVRREGLEGGVDLVLKFLLVGEEPGAFVVEGELPEEGAGFFAEA